MPISSTRSPSRVTGDWDALVAREVTRQEGIEAAFDCADACERLGDPRLALDWLDRAGELSGGLSPAGCGQRARLVDELERGDPLICPRSDLAGGREAGMAAGRAVDAPYGELPPRGAFDTCAWFER